MEIERIEVNWKFVEYSETGLFKPYDRTIQPGEKNNYF